MTGLPTAIGSSLQQGPRGPPAGPNTRSASRGGGRARIPVAPYVLADDSNFTPDSQNIVSTSSDSSNNMSSHSFGPVNNNKQQDSRSN